jgi:precorrin-2 dehydrogenase/sirohydrochlorin ferrochelatase
MNYYPIFLDLRGRPCLVVGGGKIGSRKVEGLLAAGAIVTVISPQVTEIIERFARSGKLRHLRRRYREGDLKGYFLAFAATGVAEVNVLMACEASHEGVLLNVVDRRILCGFISPARVQRGELSIAISTGGQCPGFAKRLRQKLEILIGREYGAALAAAGTARQVMLQDLSAGENLRKRGVRKILQSAFKNLDQLDG